LLLVPVESVSFYVVRCLRASAFPPQDLGRPCLLHPLPTIWPASLRIRFRLRHRERSPGSSRRRGARAQRPSKTTGARGRRS